MFPLRKRNRKPTARDRQRKGMRLGAMLGVACVTLLSLPGAQGWKAAGPMNAGHRGLACGECHLRALGSSRQQLQANVRYLLALRSQPVDFALRKVANADCLECHRRPNDRHPVFRFVEPRFADAREQLAPQHCVSCHREHTGVRVSVAAGFCSTCHQDLELETDPLDVAHMELAAGGRWQTCLGCHDFHGNHRSNAPERMADAVAVERIDEYLAGGRSPYPDPIFAARESRSERPDG